MQRCISYSEGSGKCVYANAGSASLMEGIWHTKGEKAAAARVCEMHLLAVYVYRSMAIVSPAASNVQMPTRSTNVHFLNLFANQIGFFENAIITVAGDTISLGMLFKYIPLLGRKFSDLAFKIIECYTSVSSIYIYIAYTSH